MTLGSAAFRRRALAALFACVGCAVPSPPVHAAGGAAEAPAVELRVLHAMGASAAAPSGWTLTANAAGTDVTLRSADGAQGAEWGLSAVAGPEHVSDSGASADAAAHALLLRTLRAMGDTCVPADAGAPRAYADYCTGCAFETPTHRGVLFYHQYQWDENQSVISYYVAWANADRWSGSGYVAVNVALSIRVETLRTPLNPYWADGKLAEAEEGLRRAGDAYNHEANIVRRPPTAPQTAGVLALETPMKNPRSRRCGVKLAFGNR